MKAGYYARRWNEIAKTRVYSLPDIDIDFKNSCGEIYLYKEPAELYRKFLGG